MGGGFTSALEGIYKSCLCMDITVCRQDRKKHRGPCAGTGAQAAGRTEKAIVWPLTVCLPGAPPTPRSGALPIPMRSQQLARQISKQRKDIQGQVLSLVWDSEPYNPPLSQAGF